MEISTTRFIKVKKSYRAQRKKNLFLRSYDYGVWIFPQWTISCRISKESIGLKTHSQSSFCFSFFFNSTSPWVSEIVLPIKSYRIVWIQFFLPNWEKQKKLYALLYFKLLIFCICCTISEKKHYYSDSGVSLVPCWAMLMLRWAEEKFSVILALHNIHPLKPIFHAPLSIENIRPECVCLLGLWINKGYIFFQVSWKESSRNHLLVMSFYFLSVFFV